MKHLIIILTIFQFSFISCAFSYDTKTELNEFEKSPFNGKCTVASTTQLPSYIETLDDQITFFADKNEVSTFSIAIYFINRTHKSIMLSCEDGFHYFFLEGLFFNGEWFRAQTHKRSCCGNSYYFTKLGHNEFLKTYSYFPSSGIKTKIRYSCQTWWFPELSSMIFVPNIKSNVIDGFIRLEDVSKSLHDCFSEEYQKSHFRIKDFREMMLINYAQTAIGKSEDQIENTIKNRRDCLEKLSFSIDPRFFSTVAYILKNDSDDFKRIALRVCGEVFDEMRQKQIPALKTYNSMVLPTEVFFSLASSDKQVQYFALKTIYSYLKVKTL